VAGVAEGNGVGEAVVFLSVAGVSFPLLTHMLMPPTTIRKTMICPRHPTLPDVPPLGSGTARCLGVGKTSARDANRGAAPRGSDGVLSPPDPETEGGALLADIPTNTGEEFD
jgi:hypothetical protein